MSLLRIRFRRRTDLYFRLRGGIDLPSELAPVAARIREVFAGESPAAMLLLDPVVAAWEASWPELIDAARTWPEVVAGVRAGVVVEEVGAALAAVEGSAVAEAVIESDAKAVGPAVERLTAAAASLDRGVRFVAEIFDVALPSEPIDVVLVADGVFRGGLTGHTIDERPVCFVATDPHGGSTLHEAVIHEATHAVLSLAHGSGDAIDVLRGGLRGLGSEFEQAWHVPFFLTAAEAVRRFVDPTHQDYGVTRRYYERVGKSYDVAEGPWRRRLAGEIAASVAAAEIVAAARAAVGAQSG